MAVLVEGQKFALSSKSQTSKSVVYVKLTDSALRSLEDYLKNKVRYFFPLFVDSTYHLTVNRHSFRVILNLLQISKY